MTVGSVGLDRDLFDGKSVGNQVQLSAPDELMSRCDRSEFSLIGVYRLHLSNPDFCNRIRSGELLTPYEQRFVSELI